MRRTKEEAEVTRQRLIEAALVVFRRVGYEAARLEDIAEEAGVTRGALYHHFGGKPQIYEAMIAKAMSRINQVIEAAVGTGGGALVTLRRLLVDSLMHAADDAEYRAVSEIILFKSPVTDELMGGVERKISGNRAYTALIAQFIRDGIATGEIRVDVVPEDAAIHFLALQNGLLTLWLLDPGLFSLRDRVNEHADMFFRALSR